eukprot:5993401-Amphidinium_carterae.1
MYDLNGSKHAIAQDHQDHALEFICAQCRMLGLLEARPQRRRSTSIACCSAQSVKSDINIGVQWVGRLCLSVKASRPNGQL